MRLLLRPPGHRLLPRFVFAMAIVVRIVVRIVVTIVVTIAVTCVGTASASPAREAQPAPASTGASASQPADAHGAVTPGDAVEAHAADAPHDASIWPLVAKLVNFGILVGALVYLLRSPLATYFRDRRTQIRSDLVSAAEVRQAATEQLATLERRMAALPGELETLKAEGARDVQAEEDRIRRAAEAERERLLEQTRREIDLQVRVARRDLMREAAELAVGVARTRFESRVTPEDHARMLDQSTEQIARVARRGDGPAEAGRHEEAGRHHVDAGPPTVDGVPHTGDAGPRKQEGRS